MIIPPHRLARIDQDVAELDTRLAGMVAAYRSFHPDKSDVELFLVVASSIRAAVYSPDDSRTIELLLAMAVMRLAQSNAYG